MGTRVGALVVLVAVGAALVLWAPHVAGQIAAMGASIKHGWSRAMLSRPQSQLDGPERGTAAGPGPEPRVEDSQPAREATATATASPAPAGPPSTAAPVGQALALPPRPAEPPRTAPERSGAVTPGRPIVVPHGATVADIALKTYGGYNLLAIDLIKELNPHIGNLNWIRAGEQLRLPALDAETLIRQQADGSYHLIIGSFLSSQAAERTRDRLRRAGYQATSTTRRLTDNLEVHRVELTGLPTREVAQQAWNTARANCWLQITDGPCERTTHG